MIQNAVPPLFCALLPTHTLQLALFLCRVTQVWKLRMPADLDFARFRSCLPKIWSARSRGATLVDYGLRGIILPSKECVKYLEKKFNSR